MGSCWRVRLQRPSELQRSLTPSVKRLFANWFWGSTTRTEQRRELPGVMLRLPCWQRRTRRREWRRTWSILYRASGTSKSRFHKNTLYRASGTIKVSLCFAPQRHLGHLEKSLLKALVPGCLQCCLVLRVYLGVFGSSKTSVNVPTRLCLEKLKMLPRSSLSTITMPSE